MSQCGGGEVKQVCAVAVREEEGGGEEDTGGQLEVPIKSYGQTVIFMFYYISFCFSLKDKIAKGTP